MEKSELDNWNSKAMQAGCCIDHDNKADNALTRFEGQEGCILGLSIKGAIGIVCYIKVEIACQEFFEITSVGLS